MTPLMRNRLIGGSVVLLTAMLFVPAILNPEQKTLNNPNLAIDIETEKPQVNDEDEGVLLSEVEAISLSSLDEKKVRPENATRNSPARQGSQENQSQGSNQQPTVKLESLATESNQTTSAQPIKRTVVANVAANTASQSGNWVRVGSFADLHNAENLSTNLGNKGFKTKVTTITVSGSNYHRVLIGPFRSKKTMEKTIQLLKSQGLSPSVQH